jgi:hypothetical protein
VEEIIKIFGSPEYQPSFKKLKDPAGLYSGVKM